MQTRIQSMIETGANVAIGYVIALLSQIAIFPLFGIHASIGTNIQIGAWFTVISIVHGRIDRSEIKSMLVGVLWPVHGRIDRSENVCRADCRFAAVHGRIDRSEN